jgi:hypothetical protein
VSVSLDRTDKRTLVLFAVVTAAILLWGTHGEGQPLQAIWHDFVGPGAPHPEARPRLIPGVPWDQELIAFTYGCLLTIGLPVVVLCWVQKQPLASLGLALPPAGSRLRALGLALGVVAVFVVPFSLGARSDVMRAVYPLYRAAPGASLVGYELAYLLFFVALDGLLRGVLLFGLLETGASLVLAIGVETVVQATWHLGKPLPEALGSPVWGIVGGLVSFRTRSVWPAVLSHWVLNVIIDLVARGAGG